MRVQEVLTGDGRRRYLVLGEDGSPVLPAMLFLKYLDSIGRARNTLHSYAYNLRLYFEFLHSASLDYRGVTLHDMGRFVLWLKTPSSSGDRDAGLPAVQARARSTVNLAISVVTRLYDYLWRQGDLGTDLNEKMRTQLPVPARSYKGFLHGIARGRPVQANVLRQPTPRRKPMTLSREQVEALVDACGNVRDRLLLTVLYESALRIGEALALWIEDVDVPRCKLHIRDRGELANGAEIKTASGPRQVDVSRSLINQILDYVAVVHTDDITTNHLFVKLRGRRAGDPLAYEDVNDLFRRLAARTGIRASAHVFRHSSLTALAQAGWKPEHLRLRAGHRQFHTTYQVYVHPTDEDVRRDWDRTEECVRVRPVPNEGQAT